MNRSVQILWVAVVFLGMLSLPGCWISAGAGGGGVAVNPGKGYGPPAHAPAHGYRAKHRYQYYPDARVYFDVGSGRYFYPDGSSWRVSVSPPSSLRVRLGSSVFIDMDSDRPYLKNSEHVGKYPPGKYKKKGKSKKYKEWK